MNLLSTILTTLVALEFFYIMYLETFSTSSKATSKVFNMSQEELRRESTSLLFKNQGVYNGLIGVGLLYGAYISTNPKELVLTFLAYIIMVALYGAITVDKKILLKQGGLAIITLLVILFS